MSVLKQLHAAWRRITSDDLSEEWWRQNERREQTQGWEGPRWRTPKEITEIRQTEQLESYRSGRYS
jgi:hypothetical protein